MRSPFLALLALILLGVVAVLRSSFDPGRAPEGVSIAGSAIDLPRVSDQPLASPEVEPEIVRSEVTPAAEIPAEFRSEGTIEVFVRVVDPDEAPLEGIVVLEARTGDPWATTDARGEAYRLHRPSGSFDVLELAIRSAGYTHERRTIQFGRMPLTAHRVGAKFVLHPIGALEGRVVRRGGGPFTAVVHAHVEAPELESRVAARFAGGEPATSVWIDLDGTYRLDGLTPGRWRVAASHDGRGWSWSDVLSVEQAGSTPVEDLVLIEAAPDPTLDGRVVDPAGLPVADARVCYTLARGGSGSRSTDEHGRFVIPGPPGDIVTLEVRAGPGFGVADGQGTIGAAPVELVLPTRPVLVVRLEVPSGFRAGDVEWRLLDAAEDVLLTHRSRSDEERLDWPEDAAWIDFPADDRLAGARAALPPRPPQGEGEVTLTLRRADH